MCSLGAYGLEYRGSESAVCGSGLQPHFVDF